MGGEKAIKTEKTQRILFDTHAHLSDERFNDDRGALLAVLPEKGLALVLDCATSPDDWQSVSENAQTPYVYAAYGVHPHEAGHLPGDYLQALEKYLQTEKCVALGEIGLDYHYDFCPKEQQKRALQEQLELAVALDRPVILHDREAHEDMLQALVPYKGKLRGVMHCYSGSAEMARDFLDLGLYLGFGGAITFHNAKRPQTAAQQTPIDRLLLETDCPYMTPVPYRGKRNDPSFLRLSCEKLAQLHGCSFDEMAMITLQNGKALFQIGL